MGAAAEREEGEREEWGGSGHGHCGDPGKVRQSPDYGPRRGGASQGEVISSFFVLEAEIGFSFRKAWKMPKLADYGSRMYIG